MATLQRPQYTLTQGDSSQYTVQFLLADGVTPINITGWTFSAQVRETPGSPVVAQPVITVDVPTARVTMSFTAAMTSLLRSVHHVFDLSRVDLGSEHTYLSGTIIVYRSIRSLI